MGVGGNNETGAQGGLSPRPVNSGRGQKGGAQAEGESKSRVLGGAEKLNGSRANIFRSH